MVFCASHIFSVVTMTTDKVNSGQKQQPEDGEAGAQEPDPIEPLQDGPSCSPLTLEGSEDRQQAKPRQYASTSRGLSRLFSTFLKRRSQCSEDEGIKEERGQEKESHLDAKAPIADPEPELRNEGDAPHDLHSISSTENQVRVRRRDKCVKLLTKIRFILTVNNNVATHVHNNVQCLRLYASLRL